MITMIKSLNNSDAKIVGAAFVVWLTFVILLLSTHWVVFACGVGSFAVIVGMSISFAIRPTREYYSELKYRAQTQARREAQAQANRARLQGRNTEECGPNCTHVF